jgi:hypothetical protein
MRTMAIEIAWGGVRCQPESPLPQGAQARKLLTALWRFLRTGELPAGAVLTVVVAS